MGNNTKKESNINNAREWPSKKSLVESLRVFDSFRELCKLQLEQGYWATVAFPSKHHVNKILSLQYMDAHVLENKYGLGLSSKALSAVAYCKSYLAFVKESEKDGRDKN